MTSATKSRPRALRPLAAAALSAAALFGPQAAGFASAAPDPAATPGSACADVEVVFARGTFEAPGVGDTGQAFVNALNSRVPGQTVNVYGVNYPASLDFQDAIQGVADASNEIQSTAANCPNTAIVLGGYSQGAAVAGFTTSDSVPAGVILPAGLSGPMPPAIADHVAAVVLFGLPDSWFLNLVDHSAPPIAIGPLYAPKTLQLCNPGDPVCSPGGLDRAAHSAYKNNGAADQAAAFVANALSTTASARQDNAA
ncbi:cutinase family protein [Mycobacterium sp. GA-2829]|uniref:cutinase family protein n=1 Tax=Mycobacterium sp. GA-2829 TaxID=1772283 RepID=UPI00074024BA|nr:cutinase family protein [Mycobacterium sp. GA-2829]KUI21694.1 cutinase [Mycobacterium sp. GA-2829]